MKEEQWLEERERKGVSFVTLRLWVGELRAGRRTEAKKNKKTPSIPSNGRERQQETLKGKKEAEKPPGATVCLLLLDPPTVDAEVWKYR